MIKNSKPSPALLIPLSGANFLFTLPFAVTADYHFCDMPGMLFVFAFCGGACGVICNYGLTKAYCLSEVSLAYPLSRALPVILTMLTSFAAGIGKNLTFSAVVSMIIIFSGCMIMPLDSFSNIRKSSFFNRSLPGIIVAACGTTGYTIFDSLGVKLFIESNRHIPVWQASLAYSNLRETFLFTTLITSVMILPFERKKLSLSMFKKISPYLAGIFSGMAYALILISMLYVNNVSYVQAFRQISLPIGMLMGVLFLHEKCNAPKIIGMILILSGLVMSIF